MEMVKSVCMMMMTLVGCPGPEVIKRLAEHEI